MEYAAASSILGGGNPDPGISASAAKQGRYRTDAATDRYCADRLLVAELPAHVCTSEIVISPTWNRLVLGGKDLERKL
jgi:hypothetical protein